MIQVLLVEDQKLVIAGFEALLKDIEGIRVVGKVQNGKEAVAFLAAHPDPVDVALVDIEMPEMNGLQLTEYIRKNHAKTKVLILSMYKKAQYIRSAMKQGAKGYMLKDNADLEELTLAIKEIAEGGIHFGNDVNQIYFNSLQEDNVLEEGRAKLSSREKEVLQCIVDGLKGWEIGEKLFIAPSTVETHRRHLIEKLKVKTTPQLVTKAIKEKYL